jgi:ribose transport system ATP-binding protein
MKAGSAGVEIVDLVKSYGTNRVLDGVNLSFEAGRVHALLGANGAGKSTLLGCLSGATRPDSGELRVGGDVHTGFTPREAFQAGVAIIYQHFQLIGSLSVGDNIFLGQEIRTKAGTVDRRRQDAEARRILAELGIEMDPRAVVETLSVGQQQMVEIARSIRRRPSVLILDEPTAALGAHEVEALLALVRRLAHEEGLAVVYVTHLLGEVLDVADDVTVLRDGRVHWTRPRGDLRLEDLVEGISPAATTRAVRPETDDLAHRDVLLELQDYRSTITGPVDVTLRAGEILGVYGLLGSGRTDLLESLAGVRPRTGTVRVDGRPAALDSPRRAQRSGLVLVASDRKAQSLFGTLPAIENLLMPHYSRLGRLRRPRTERAMFAEAAQTVGLTPPRASAPADSFSGGNAQKIAVARWTSVGANVRCLLLDEPTQGVDIGARQDLYASIRAFAQKNGAAVIFASSDPEEVLALADSVLVLVGGSVVHTGPAAALDEFELAHKAQPLTTQETSR